MFLLLLMLLDRVLRRVLRKIFYRYSKMLIVNVARKNKQHWLTKLHLAVGFCTTKMCAASHVVAYSASIFSTLFLSRPSLTASNVYLVVLGLVRFSFYCPHCKALPGK